MKKYIQVSIGLSLLAMVTLSGCGDSDDEKSVTVLEPKAISFKSDRDYNNNSYGVITASTLTKWLDDWKTNKPAGVEGRLVVLQAGTVSFDQNRTFLPHNDSDVLVYGIPGGGACDPSYKRFDGISNTPGAMVAGQNIDGNVNYYQIDPEKDFVVVAVAEGSTAIREITRTWWSMIYWGWDMKHIAFLNGSVAYNFANKKDYLVAQPSPMPKITHEYHMSTLKTDRTSLHLYIDEMKEIAKKEDKSGYFIVDARGTAEYDGTKASKSASKRCGINHDKQCLTAFRGHIKGAVDFPYTDILIMDDETEDLNGDGVIDKNDASFKFKSYDDLTALYAQKGYKEGDTVIAYCRTGRKSTLSALTATTVLGYPYRMYDGSWMQWGMMAHAKDTNGTFILPESSSVRTDTDTYSVIYSYNDSIDINPADIYKIDSNATKSQMIKEEDQAYLK
jgi:3-mercaptopyruvate sulfurtransferase SseA